MKMSSTRSWLELHRVFLSSTTTQPSCNRKSGAKRRQRVARTSELEEWSEVNRKDPKQQVLKLLLELTKEEGRQPWLEVVLKALEPHCSRDGELEIND